MMGACLTLVLILICHPAKAQDSQVHGSTPVLGVNIWEWPCPKGYNKTSENQICVHVSTLVDMDTIKLAKLYGTTQFDIRTANPTRTLAFCRKPSGNWRRGTVVDIERDRPSNAVWNGCDQERQYAYIIPGETVLIERNKVSLSFGEKQELLRRLQACKANDWNCAKPLIRKLNPGLSEQALEESLAGKPNTESPTNPTSPNGNVSSTAPKPPVPTGKGADVKHPPTAWESALAFVRGEAWLIGIHIAVILLLITASVFIWQWRKQRREIKEMKKRIEELENSEQTVLLIEGRLRDEESKVVQRDQTIQTERLQNETHATTIHDLKEKSLAVAMILRELLAYFSTNENVKEEDLADTLRTSIREHRKSMLETVAGLSLLVTGRRQHAGHQGTELLSYLLEQAKLLVARMYGAMETEAPKDASITSAIDCVIAHVHSLRDSLQTKKEEIARVSEEKEQLADSLAGAYGGQSMTTTNPGNGNGGGNRKLTLMGPLAQLSSSPTPQTPQSTTERLPGRSVIRSPRGEFTQTLTGLAKVTKEGGEDDQENT